MLREFSRHAFCYRTPLRIKIIMEEETPHCPTNFEEFLMDVTTIFFMNSTQIKRSNNTEKCASKKSITFDTKKKKNSFKYKKNYKIF